MKLINLTPAISLTLLTMVLFSCQNVTESETNGDRTGVTDSEIVIGSWGPLTGPAALWGSILKGTDAYFKLINEEGGIHGRKIKFVFKDDAYDPSRTVPAVRELVQRDEIFAVAGGIGTATNMAVVDFLTENSVPWISPMTGASFWTTPTKENIFTSFPLYFDEGDVMAKYAIEDLASKKIGIIYQNDDFGKSGLVGAKYQLQQQGLEFVEALPVEISDTDLSSHVARLKEAGAEVVLIWVLPRQAAIILGSAAVIGFQPTWLSSLVLSDVSLMHNITKGAWEGVIFNYPAEVMFNDTSSELMMKYRASFEKYYPDERWGVFPASGYLWIEPMVEGLRAAGPSLTRESFLDAMSKIKNFRGAGGVPITFTKENHLGTRSVCLMRCKSGTEVEIVKEFVSGAADLPKMIELLEEM